jgi:hypothetical protein
MFNNKRIKELEKSVRALTSLVDFQDVHLHGGHSGKGIKFGDDAYYDMIGVVDKVAALERYLDVERVTVRPTHKSVSYVKKIYAKEKK